MTASEREALRRRYFPAQVRVLFVGESPPAGGTFSTAAIRCCSVKGVRRAHRACVPSLAKTLSEVQPHAIVVLLKSIENSVARAAADGECQRIERHTLTYPSRRHKHRVSYREQLAALLRDLAQRGVL